MKGLICSIFVFCGLAGAQEEAKLLKLGTTAEIERADLYLWKPGRNVVAVMIFCPGHNGSGEGFVNDPEWQKFARTNNLALCGLSFASQMVLTEQGFGYSHVDRESGKILLDAIDKEFARKQLPLLFYGYSAGARFSTSFLAWKPERVLTWCASGVGNWPALPAGAKTAPGIVACGEFDAGCYWSSLHYFQCGRENNYPWIWISLEGLGHEQSPVLDRFVAEYFALKLKGGASGSSGADELLDITTKHRIKTSNSNDRIFSASLPSSELLVEHWTRIHTP